MYFTVDEIRTLKSFAEHHPDIKEQCEFTSSAPFLKPIERSREYWHLLRKEYKRYKDTALIRVSCWNHFCKNYDCNQFNHVNYTGYTWYEGPCVGYMRYYQRRLAKIRLTEFYSEDDKIYIHKYLIPKIKYWRERMRSEVIH